MTCDCSPELNGPCVCEKFAPDFGTQMFVAHLAFRGTILKEHCDDLTRELVVLVGMTPRMTFCDSFDDVGENVGITFFRSLIESYVVVDSYYPKQAGGFINICSCKPFDATKVQQYLEDRRLEVVDAKVYELRL